MKRDFDIIRSLLLQIEGSDHPFAEDPYFEIACEDGNAAAYAMHLLAERNLIQVQDFGDQDKGINPWEAFYFPRLTWEGHDFLDSIRDPEVWRKTKEGAKQAGSFSFDLVKALAKGLVKKKVEQHTGIALEF